VNGVEGLAEATAYRVDTRDGRIGSVAAVLPSAGPHGSGVLLVHTGLLLCRLEGVAFEEVAEVDPVARRVVLTDAAAGRVRAAA
jgi:hypothetical protein